MSDMRSPTRPSCFPGRFFHPDFHYERVSVQLGSTIHLHLFASDRQYGRERSVGRWRLPKRLPVVFRTVLAKERQTNSVVERPFREKKQVRILNALSSARRELIGFRAKSLIDVSDILSNLLMNFEQDGPKLAEPQRDGRK